MRLAPWITALLVLALAAPGALAVPPKWLARYNEMKTYEDMGYLSKVEKAPKQETLKKLKLLKTVIMRNAKLFDIDPRAVVGSILAEHTMNVQDDDLIQDKMVESGLAPKGNFFGKKFTYGFGQLNFDRAQSVEKLCAKLGRRPERTDDQIGTALLVPEEAIGYVACLIREEQDAYAAAGFPIKDNVPVLTTLYNIGRIKERIVRLKSEKRLPKPNYFGFWVEMNMAALEEVTGPWPPPSKEDAAAKLAAASAAGAAPVPALAAAPIDLPEPMTELRVSTTEIKVYRGPISCFDMGIVPESTESLGSGKQFFELETDQDCDGEAWIRIRGDDGKIGWVRRKDAEKSSTAKSVPSGGCKSEYDRACAKKLKEQFPEYVERDFDSAGRATFSLLAGTQIRTTDQHGVLEQTGVELMKRATGLEAQLTGIDNLKKSEIAEIRKQIVDFQRRSATALKLDPWDNDGNPYVQYFTPIFERFAETCIAFSACAMNSRAFRAALANVKFKKDPSYDELRSNDQITESFKVYENFGRYEKEKIEPMRKYRETIAKQLIEPFDDCRRMALSYPKVQEYVMETELELAATLREGPATGAYDDNNSGNHDAAPAPGPVQTLAEQAAMYVQDPVISFDVNGDGQPDVDENADGVIDYDINGDGETDYDEDGDGIVDIDENGDGDIDLSKEAPDPSLFDARIKAQKEIMAKAQPQLDKLKAQAAKDKAKAIKDWITAKVKADKLAKEREKRDKQRALADKDKFLPAERWNHATQLVNKFRPFFDACKALGNLFGFPKNESAARASPEQCPVPSDMALNEWGGRAGLQLREAIEPLLASKAKREEHALEQLKAQRPTMNAKGLFTIRMLADRVAAVACAKTVYVPQPWLVSSTNEIFNENLGPSEIVIDLEQTTCKIPEERAALPAEDEIK